MPAIPYTDTAVIDEPWDANKEVGALSNDAGEAVFRKMYAWVDPDKDPNTKAAYSLPHHKVVNGAPQAANVPGVRNALSRLPQSDIPTADHSAVQAHLNKHLDKFNAGKTKSEQAAMPGWEEAGDAHIQAELVMVAGKVWAMQRTVLESLEQRFAGRVVAGDIEAAKATAKATLPVQGNGVAVVPIEGMIVPKLTFMAWLMGADYGLDEMVGMIKQAVADPDVKSVVLNIDSPGGLVDGLPEAAATIRQLRDSSGKPFVAVANTLAASAAYWLASQCHEVVVTPSGEVGSVGVYQKHMDISGRAEQMGVKHTLISAGKYKTEGNPFEPLDPEAAAAIQQSVNDYYGMFVGDIAQARDVEVDPEELSDGSVFGGGRTFTAKRAVKAGLADKVATLGETVSRLSSGRARVRRHSAEEEGEPVVASSENGEAQEVSLEDRHRLVHVLAQLR